LITQRRKTIQASGEIQIPRCTMDILRRVRLTDEQRLCLVATALRELHPGDAKLQGTDCSIE